MITLIRVWSSINCRSDRMMACLAMLFSCSFSLQCISRCFILCISDRFRSHSNSSLYSSHVYPIFVSYTLFVRRASTAAACMVSNLFSGFRSATALASLLTISSFNLCLMRLSSLEHQVSGVFPFGSSIMSGVVIASSSDEVGASSSL